MKDSKTKPCNSKSPGLPKFPGLLYAHCFPRFVLAASNRTPHSGQIISPKFTLLISEGWRSELTPDQISSIDSIDRTLSVLTHMGPQHWTEIAVRKSLEWQRLRTLAAKALDSFGWPLETPPSHADEIIGGHELSQNPD